MRDELRRPQPADPLALSRDPRDVLARDERRAAASSDDEDTFCAVVPGKHAFTLAGGVYTGNCGACEPECPVEAIFPEDALPG